MNFHPKKVIRINGRIYSEDLLYYPVKGEDDCDFYNLAFAAICEWKKKKKKQLEKSNRPS